MKKLPYILTIDQGTTSSRALIYSPLEEKIIAIKQLEFTQFFPHDGWVEHDLNEIWSSTVTVIRQVVEEVELEQIEAIGITNQRETTALWKPNASGLGQADPLHRAIVWQDRRTTERCTNLKKQGLEKMVREKTGLFLDPYFCASKIEWALNHLKLTPNSVKNQSIKFGTIDGFLLWNLTGGKTHTIDTTNASRTGLFNIHKKKWDEDLLKIYNIPSEILPEVKPSNSLFGHTTKDLIGKELPIYGMVGDQQSSLFGHNGFQKGAVKSTYGTGAFLLINTGETPVLSKTNLLTTIGIDVVGKPTSYAFEGSIFIAGALFKWLKEKVGLIDDYSTLNHIEWNTEHSDSTYFVPAFSGLGAPHWNPRARGMLLGITRDTDRNHILESALKSIAYQTHDLLAGIQSENINLATFKVDGGVSQNDKLCQYMANLLGIPLERPLSVETTAIGGAMMAALGCGIFSNLEDIPAKKDQHTFSPTTLSGKEKQAQAQNLKKWSKAIEATQYFAQK